jgi:hypothetical protein
VELERATLELVAEVTGPAHGRPGQRASLVAFRGTGIGDPVGQLPEIDHCRWLGPADVHLLAPLARAAAEQAWVERQAVGGHDPTDRSDRVTGGATGHLRREAPRRPG